MPQIQLPIFPEGVTRITPELAFQKRDGQVYYFNGQMPVFSHAVDDLATFKMITSQFVVNGNAKQCEIAKAFGVHEVSVRRAVKKYREKGPRGFYEPRRTRGAVVLTPSVLKEAQEMLNEGHSLKEVGDELGIKTNTLNKAVQAGKLHRVSVKKTLQLQNQHPS